MAARTVTIRFLGPVRRPAREREMGVELGEDATVGGLLASLGYQPHELDFFALSVNGEKARGTTALSHGDQVTLALLAGGG